MIYFLTNDRKIDLTHLSLGLNEESNYFSNDTLQSYSDPVDVNLDSELAIAIGLPFYKNIASAKSKIEGKLVIGQKYFTAYFELGKFSENTAEITLFYGNETLSVYDKNLKDLSWPIISTNGLVNYAEQVIQESWPNISHSWPMIYNSEIVKETDYSAFESFVNNYDSGFIENETINSADGTIFNNKNVMAPHVYILEILKQGYAQENKVLRGDIIRNERFKSALYMPTNYFEEFTSNDNFEFSFDYKSRTFVFLGISNLYQKLIPINRKGIFELKMKINLDISLVKHFILQIDIYEDDFQKTLLRKNSTDLPVNIDETLNIEIDDETVFKNLRISLIIPENSVSIEDFNWFNLQYSDGKQNVFPTVFSLSDFMPDMTFGDFENLLKNSFNLDISTTEDAVYINFLEENFNEFITVNNSDIEDPGYELSLNNNRVYKLSNSLNELITVDSSGVIFTDSNTTQEVIDLEIGIIQSKSNNYLGNVTVRTPDSDDFYVCFYNGVNGDGKPLPVRTIGELDFTIESIYNEFWKKWLFFRTNSKTIVDNYIASLNRKISFKESVFKYNEKSIPIKVNMNSLNEYLWEYEVEMETI